MSGETALVIGIGPGLGQALVRRFALAGMRVAFTGRRKQVVATYEAAMRAEGLDVTGFTADAGDPVAMAAVHAAVAELYGPPAVLIYNAAQIEPARFVTEAGKDEVKYGGADGWQARRAPADSDYLLACLRTNVVGAHDAARQVAPAMLKAGRGTILLTGGVLAFGPWLEWGVVSLGKAALRSLGLSLEKELSSAGVHVCTVAIHGTMEKGTAYDHDLVAGAYLMLHQQPRDEWTAEYHFRAVETDGESDPDL